MSASQPPNVILSLAEEADLQRLGEINALAYLPETIMAFFFPAWPNIQVLLPFFDTRIREKFFTPKCQTFKVTDTASNEIIAFVCLIHTDHDVEPQKATVNPGSNFVPPPGFNMEFGGFVIGELQKLEDIMKGTEHLLLTSLAVHPKYQKKGLGSLLMRHCMEIGDAAGLPIYLTAFPGAHPMYMKLGFKDLTYFDVDLNEWGTKQRGYGVYRSYAMLRQPGKGLEGLEKVDPPVS